MGLARSDFYRKRATTSVEEKEIEIDVIHCFDKHNSNYGRIRIKQELNAEYVLLTGNPFPASEHKISQILKKYERIAKTGRKNRKKSKKPTGEVYINENLIKKKFNDYKVNELWSADISEIKCKGTKIYVSGIIDVGTRRIVGWDIQTHMRQEIVHNAIKMAVGRNPERAKNAIFHSDRGCQYTSKLTTEILKEKGFQKSMSRPGSPNENQIIESFWKTLKLEMGRLKEHSVAEAKRKIVEYIEMEYNSSRIHSGIGYITPNAKYAQAA